MSAENELAKVIADAIAAKTGGAGSSTVPAVFQGTDAEGKGWVLLPGATEPTPVSRMAVEAAQGDTVSVTIANGKATVDSNVSNPSAGLAGVKVVERTANTASATANEALTAASDARSAANSAQASADTARQAATDATVDAGTARAMAESASADAATASASAAIAKESADKATYALSDVENVVGTLNWIAEHGEYVLTEDTAIVEGKAYYTQSGGSYVLTEDTVAQYGKTYYTRSGSGTDEDPYVYAAVSFPDTDDESTATYHVTSQPRTAIIGAIGDSVSFSVESNDDGASYRWKYKRPGASSWSNTTLAGYNTSTLGPFTSSTTNAESGREYRCLVTFSDSTTENSGSATISVGELYEFFGEPTYTLVTSPVAAELPTYYELSIDESVQNYIASHIYLLNDGLYVTTDSSDYKVRIDGDSVDIIDGNGEVVSSFGETIQLGRSDAYALYEAGNSLLDGSGMQMLVHANGEVVGRDFFGLGDLDEQLRCIFVFGDNDPTFKAGAENSDTESAAYINAQSGTFDGGISLLVTSAPSGSTTKQCELLVDSGTGVRLLGYTFSGSTQTTDYEISLTDLLKEQALQNAVFVRPSGASQIWEIRATGRNTANTSMGSHRVGLILQNTSLGAYDYTSGSTLWTLDGDKTTVTTVSYIFSAITSGITITSAAFTSRNGVAQLTFIARGFSGTGSKSIGTLNAAYRPASDVVGGSTARYVSHTEITSAGAVSSYWETATSSTANTFTFSYTYLL